METRAFGTTGLNVSVLGLGAGHIGDAQLPEQEVERLLNGALDLGITLIDTARGYGLSEERIGRHLHARRKEYVLSTKIGYRIPGCADWTGPCIEAGIAAAVKRLNTDRLDIVHLHSCPREVLERGEVIEALERAVQAGTVRVAAYSGDNDALEWAVRSGKFGSIQTSVNLCDQHVITRGLAEAQARGLGVIAKRPVANAPWRFSERPTGDYAEVYWERWKAMQIDPGPYAWQELALRFTAGLPGVNSLIIGTRDLGHLNQDAAWIERGPLPLETTEMIRQAFVSHDRHWMSET